MDSSFSAAINIYLDIVKSRFATGISTEHSYRADLQNLLYELCADVIVTNEPRRQACGAPDYIITNKKNIPIGYIEAKDIGKSIGKDQFDRYRLSLDNLIITDYLDFQFYRNSELKESVSIAKVENGQVVLLPENFSNFTDLLHSFCLYVGQTIKSSSKLSKMMAAKARLLANVIKSALDSDDEQEVSSTLKEQMLAFQNILMHDIDNNKFADIYAQTIAYGMFAARLHDETLDTFSRQEAAELIPKSNPFLRSLFGYIAGPDIDDRIEWIVSDLADIFRATDVKALLKDFGKATAQTDPMIHFYETFLGEYDKKLKKARGVWYTPEPVVNFIVRAVDDLLKSEFGLPQGLADTSKTTIEVKSSQGGDRRYKDGHKRTKHEVHKVQILDPATGTGTFLAEVIKHIHAKFQNQQGIWSSYVEEHLIPRLNGFEILMASYAMAHLKLDLLLTETGYKPASQPPRLKVFLTNSLEEHHPDTGTLFATWLAREADEANRIKRDSPIMVVLGNPPYSIKSSNKGEWIQSLISDYKHGLNERKLNLNDDYIKFIRYGEHYIENNGEGVLAFITSNSFIDGITHRQMRKHLLDTFDEIFILDLHGNAKKKEIAPGGGKDENVFDIQQGVSINIFLKTGKKGQDQLAQVNHFDLYGSRKGKYDLLSALSVDSIKWKILECQSPYYFFVPKDFSEEDSYTSGFKVSELFLKNNTGIQTKRDKLVYSFTINELRSKINNLLTNTIDEFKTTYDLPDDGRDWTIQWAKEDIQKHDGLESSVLYRPFDTRATSYTGKSKGFMAYPRSPLMQEMLHDNIALLLVRNSRRGNVNNVFISKDMVDKDGVSPYDNCKFFPLYLHPDKSALEQTRIPNLNFDIVHELETSLASRFASEKTEELNTFAPIDILDYIYAVLHSPSYREKYKEFLKIDFPRVPYPDAMTFWRLVKLGGQLRQIHLLEAVEAEEYVTSYPVDGDNTITRQIVKGDFKITDTENAIGQVWINDEQYFDKVPAAAWEFYIGGHQPAQKWLKDRKRRALSFEDILHYQKIIKALLLTDQYMKEIDKVIVV